MAVVAKSIIAGGGGDYTTVTAWESGCAALGGDLICKGEIQDATFYDETVTISVGGTGTATSYVWLTVSPAFRHYGVAGVGAGVRRFIVQTKFTHLSWLDIHCHDSTSSRGIQLFDSDGSLIDYCIVRSSRGEGAPAMDGISVNSAQNKTVYISNCIVYGWNRAAILLDSDAITNTSFTVYLDHNTISSELYLTGTVAEGGPVFAWMDGTGNTHDIVCFNNIFYVEEGAHGPIADGAGGVRGSYTLGQVNWYGSNNLGGDQSDPVKDLDAGSGDATAAWQVATDGHAATSKTSGAWVVFENITHGSEVFLLLDAEAGNLAAGNAVDRVGLEPDPRQHFEVDITGVFRPFTDICIGAHQCEGFAVVGPMTGPLVLRGADERMWMTRQVDAPSGRGKSGKKQIADPYTRGSDDREGR